MSEPIHFMVQMRSSPALAAAAFGPLSASPSSRLAAIPGVTFDEGYPPVPVPPTPTDSAGAFLAMAATPAESTYVVRASVSADRVDDFLHEASSDATVVGVFADPRIQPIAPVCPLGPVGTDLDVATLLAVGSLHTKGMDGTGVRVVVVDTGVNLLHLQLHGKQPAFDANLSWGPRPNQPLGAMPVGHGTMCAYDVCIAAPRCTLVDHALLTSNTPGGSPMDGFLSDAVQSFGLLLSHQMQAPTAFAGDAAPRTLVVNNSWGMFHPSWDFPVGSPQNYSDNLQHPFNILVSSLEAAGADILFAAGNCGTECPDGRCQGLTTAGIFGANSHPAVLSVAGVKVDRQRIGYSTKGPGRLDSKKPDIASYTHFAGSGVYPADGGTSAATPVAAGVIAAVRRLYPASVVAPQRLRDLIRGTAEAQGTGTFDYEYGYGIISVEALLDALTNDDTTASRVSKRARRKTKKNKEKEPPHRRGPRAA